MTQLTALILFGLAALVFLVMVVQAARRSVEVPTIRNLFLAGVIVFQLASGALSLFFNEFFEVDVNDPGSAGIAFLFLISAFLAIFWFFYGRGWLVTRPARRRAGVERTVSSFAAIPVAFLLVGTGIVLRLVIGRTVPVLGVLTDIMGIGALAAGAGLAVWAWAPRFWNPAVGIPAICVSLIACFALLVGTYGRRELLSLIFTLFFAVYYSRWRQLSLMGMSYRLAIVGAGALVFVALFTSVRAATFRMKDVGSIAGEITRGDIGEGLMLLVSGQSAGAISMWTVENYPESFPYRPFASVVYAVAQPIPRLVWANKPLAFGYEIVRQSQSESGTVEEGYTMGPGLIGHIVHDNPWLALVPYAVLLGLFCRWLDEHLRLRGSDPFVVLPIAVAGGEVLGFARGELGYFFFRAAVSMLTAWVAMRLCAMVVARARRVDTAAATGDEDHWPEEGSITADGVESAEEPLGDAESRAGT